MNKKKLYWENFYKKNSLDLEIPSQFSVFVATELSNSIEKKNQLLIIDCGSGSGKDTFFFERYGFTAIGVEQSKNAIKNSSEKIKKKTIQFICGSILDQKIQKKILEICNKRKINKICIYARFFIHVLTDKEKKLFFSLSKKILNNFKEGYLALEFRTGKDFKRKKITPRHFRKYFELSKIEKLCNSLNLKKMYSTQGAGMAKYKEDDAFVGRIFLKNILD